MTTTNEATTTTEVTAPKKVRITNANMMQILLKAAALEPQTLDTLAEEAGFTPEEVIDKAERHLVVLDRAPASRAGIKSKSKERIANEEIAKKAHAVMLELGEPVTNEWLQNHVQFITTTQKATGIMRVAIDLGLVKKSEEKTEKGKMQYEALPQVA